MQERAAEATWILDRTYSESMQPQDPPLLFNNGKLRLIQVDLDLFHRTKLLYKQQQLTLQVYRYQQLAVGVKMSSCQ